MSENDLKMGFLLFKSVENRVFSAFKACKVPSLPVKSCSKPMYTCVSSYEISSVETS